MNIDLLGEVTYCVLRRGRVRKQHGKLRHKDGSSERRPTSVLIAKTGCDSERRSGLEGGR